MVADLYARLGMTETERAEDGTTRWAAAPGALASASNIAVERA
jgi:hypothetical protein